MEVTCISPDLSRLTSERLLQLVQSTSSDVVVFPEYLLELVDVPKMETNQLIVWGSKVEEEQNKLFVQKENALHTVSKISLTPWEKHLKPGEEVGIFNFRGAKIAVLICFDVEFPHLADRLKKENIDLLIVPSATETSLGYERVSRCASARAVELGCAVVTCHLIGKSSHEMIDENVGGQSLFLPSQSLFAEEAREHRDECCDEGERIQTFQIPIEKIRQQRRIEDETNPSLE